MEKGILYNCPVCGISIKHHTSDDLEKCSGILKRKANDVLKASEEFLELIEKLKNEN